jgi:hypothetical protein
MREQKRQSPGKIPTFDAVLASIAQAASPSALVGLQEIVEKYFAGTQREHLEAALTARRSEMATTRPQA